MERERTKCSEKESVCKCKERGILTVRTILTVTLPGFTASVSDPDHLSSGAVGNRSGWAGDWRHLDLPALTDLSEASLRPLLTT